MTGCGVTASDQTWKFLDQLHRSLINICLTVQIFLIKIIILFFRTSAFMEKRLFGFFIEIWYSLHQSLSQRLLNVRFGGSWPCSRCSLQYFVYRDLAFARKIFFGNLAFREDLISIKYWNSLFLKTIAFFGAPAQILQICYLHNFLLYQVAL